MDRGRNTCPAYHVTIRVSGKLFQGHLWPLLSLAHLEELDRDALLYLLSGQNQRFGIISCPNFIREWMDHEKERAAA